jgi:copper homeostasis protein
MRKIEVCCSSLYEAREAEAGGAVRIELCGAIACGGVTPSNGVIRQIVEAGLDIDINVLIRAREGGFCYTAEEVDAMCRDITLCRELGFHGVVIGALTAEGDVDMEACRKMMEAAGDMSVTFHRAFDICRDPFTALEQIISLGCDRLLTSGQQASAEMGAELIAELVKRAAGRIIIMPGAGINPKNIATIEQKTAATEFHSTAAIDCLDAAFGNAAVSFAAYPQREGIIRRSAREQVSELVNNTL